MPSLTSRTLVDRKYLHSYTRELKQTHGYYNKSINKWKQLLPIGMLMVCCEVAKSEKILYTKVVIFVMCMTG